jgi:hypothetical protein
MKLIAGIAVSVSLLFGASEPTRPEPFFQSKNQITFSDATVTKSWGTTRSTSILTVESVTEAKGSVSSVCKVQFYNDHHKLTHEYRLLFSADSLTFYVNASNWMHENWTPDKGYLYSGDSLWYPLSMKVGDTLRSAWAAEDFNTNGVKGGERDEFTKRKVVALDTIEMLNEKIVAHKIEMHVTRTSITKDQYTGNQKNVIEYDVIEWFSPTLGIVKSVHRTPYGDTRTRMESYKK